MSRPSTAGVARSLAGTKLPCFVFDSGRDLARRVAAIVAGVIRERNTLGKQAVLGLPTGSTVIGMYRELVRLHREEGLDFSQVVTFNLDEYYGFGSDHPQSYRRWMEERFFRHVNLQPENIHVPDGAVGTQEVAEFCQQYEAAMTQAGGLDLVVLGIGRNGHIGFNEPFSIRKSRTRLCTLDPVTRVSAASDFFGLENVPTQAITMGLGTILEARKIVLLALGEHKAPIVREAFEGPISDRVPASYLQEHADATVLLDEAAAGRLTGQATPWLVDTMEWSDSQVKRAVLWLCEQAGKALLKLDDKDFRNHNLHHLLRHQGPAPEIAHRVFRWMADTINHHPAGKEKKRIICFSPHPDDDVISMGGTLIRLVEDGHEVHIAYMTSGNIAVFDHDARRVADLVTEYNRLFQVDEDRSREVESRVHRALASKRPGDFDSDEVLKIKGLIRWSEAKAGAMEVGCREEHLHFLDLPFYRTGAVAKKPIGEEDIRTVRQLIEDLQPQQIYAAGDLSDPHGTHRVCADAILLALRQIEEDHGTRPELLFYRGAWQEYELHEIEIAVPLGPADVERKRRAIFMHESQKDEALFPGSDPREFWQRAEDRNLGTADRYNRIGLPEYFAMEAFVRWNGSMEL